MTKAVSLLTQDHNGPALVQFEAEGWYELASHCEC